MVKQKMETKSIKLIYFSPTGTSRRVLEGIAQGIGGENVEQVDLTLPENSNQQIQAFSDELAIIGVPVYGGRLPVDVVTRFKHFRAENTLAVLIVTYGNREFDDALLELKNLAVELGFNPIAGGAFIGEHSFASKKVPIANGRPDSLDLRKAVDFGKKIQQKVNALKAANDRVELEVPGSYPYKAEGARPMEVSPVTKQDVCSICGTCARVCPTAAISINGSRVTTKVGQCIRCCACIKNCPEGARAMENETWKHITNWLNENCGARKEPQIFGIDL